MLQIGQYKLGGAPLSMIAVFIVLSVCAIIASPRICYAIVKLNAH